MFGQQPIDDEDDDNEADPSSGPSPDKSVSSRPPLPDASSKAPSDQVMQYILNKNSSSQPSNKLQDDPLMAQYLKEQSDLDDYRKVKLQADTATNIGQSLSQMALGANAPQPNPVYKNIDTQNQELLGSKEQDMDRRRKVLDAIEARKSREEIASGNRDMRQAIADAANKDRALRQKELSASKQESQVNKWMNSMKDDLDPNKARGGNMAFNQRKVDQAERLSGLIHDTHGNIANLDSRQIEELAIGLNSMLSNSNSSAVSQVEALVPKTAIGNSTKLQEWLSNNPTGVNQIAFVQKMADTVEREKNIASSQVKKAQRQRLAAYEKFKQAAPDEYNQLLNSYGLNEPEEKPLPVASNPKSAYQPGQLVKVRGKMYRVGADGNDLEEVM
jgi:hypothetical protein